MVRDFRVPLQGLAQCSSRPGLGRLTLVLTFSKLGGLTIEKQTRKMLVCGYDNGRSRLQGPLAMIMGSSRPHSLIIFLSSAADVSTSVRTPNALTLYPTIPATPAFHPPKPIQNPSITMPLPSVHDYTHSRNSCQIPWERICTSVSPHSTPLAKSDSLSRK